MASDIAWTEETIARLRVFWRDGISTAEIGRRMGTSKNSVVGKAHRLRLPPRPSPIRGKGTSGSTPCLPAPARTRSPSQPPPPRPVVADSLPPERPPRPPATFQAPPTRADPLPPPPALAEPEKPALARPALSQPCCWPIGQPSEIAWRFARIGPASGSATPTRCLASHTAPSMPGPPTSNPKPRATAPAKSHRDLRAMGAASTGLCGAG